MLDEDVSAKLSILIGLYQTHSLALEHDLMKFAGVSRRNRHIFVIIFSELKK